MYVCVKEKERERGERLGRAGGEDKGRAVFPDVAAVCWLFAAPAPRITAFTLQLKNSPRDNLFSWSTPSSIVFPKNSPPPRLSLFLYSSLFPPYILAMILSPSSYSFLLISHSLRNLPSLYKK